MTAREAVADPDATLDAMLEQWHRWRSNYTFTRGYSSMDTTCRDHRAPGHWDWWNGAADARADELMMRAFNQAVGRVPNTPQRWNTVLHFYARNLATGAAVWTSPVLPKGAELEVLLMEARNMLLRELRAGGLIG